MAIHLLAIVATRRGDRDQALALLEESLALGRRGGDPWLLSIALNNRGDLLMGEGDDERAAELFEESLAIGEARGDLDRRARALSNLGFATHGLGDLARARDFLRRGLDAATEIGLVECQLQTLLGIAILEAEAGDAGTGARLLGRTNELASRLGSAFEDHKDALEQQTLARLEDALGPERLASELATRGCAVARGRDRPRARME